jgi:DNA-binding XRE family transcriptional regulator
MVNYLGDIIYNHRDISEMTQDQFGAKYGISGPAIFKFEKGYVKPSLNLWLKMAPDFDLTERKAVLMWVKSKLPEEFQDFVDLAAEAAEKAQGKGAKPSKARDYTTFSDRDEMRKVTMKDGSLPKALRDLLSDKELWAVYKPTGREINILRDTFGKLGRGTKSSYREALRLIREFINE